MRDYIRKNAKNYSITKKGIQLLGEIDLKNKES
jgi:hypothetical protein